MKTKAAKAKGRRLQKWVAECISRLTGLPWGKDEMIAPREMGQTGADIRLVGPAKDKFPFSVECKNQESWNIHKFMQQAKENTMNGTDWLLVLSRNDQKPVVVLDAVAFFRIIQNTDFEKKSQSKLSQK